MAFPRNSTIRATLNTSQDYVTSGLVMRLDPTVGVTKSGAEVTSWVEDGGGLDFQRLADSVGPTEIVSPAGTAALRVNDGSTGLRATGTTGLPGGAASRTLIMCWKPDLEGTAYGGFGWGDAVLDQSFKILVNGLTGDIQIDTYTSALTLGPATGDWVIVTATYDGTTVRGYLGTTQAGGDWPKTLNTGTTQTDLLLSFSNNTTEADVGAVFVYDRVLSSAEIAQMVAYLNARFVSDTKEPTITNLALANATATTLDWSFDSDEAGTYDLVVTESPTKPSKAQIEAGQEHTGAAAPYALQDQTLGAGQNSGTAMSLTAGTLHYLHVLARDSIPNEGVVQSSIGVSTSAPDTDPPVFWVTSTTPGPNGVTVAWTTDEGNGTGYLYVSQNATEDKATVKASGTSKAVSATGAQTISESGLTAETSYYRHLLHEDAAGNSNAVDSAAFTTSAAGANTTVSSAAELETALNSASAGDTIELLTADYGNLTIDNVYVSPGVTITKGSGQSPTVDRVTFSSAAWVIWDGIDVVRPGSQIAAGDTSGTVTVSGSSTRVTVKNCLISATDDGVPFEGGKGVSIDTSASNISVTDCVIRHHRLGVEAEYADFTTIARCHFPLTGEDHIKGFGNDSLIEDCLFEDTRPRGGSDPAHPDCIQNDPLSERVTIRGNIALGVKPAQGIIIGGNNGLGVRNFRDWVIEQNLFEVSLGGSTNGIFLKVVGVDNRADGTVVNNNMTIWRGYLDVHKVTFIDVRGATYARNFQHHETSTALFNGRQYLSNNGTGAFHFSAYYANPNRPYPQKLTAADFVPIAGTLADPDTHGASTWGPYDTIQRWNANGGVWPPPPP